MAVSAALSVKTPALPKSLRSSQARHRIMHLTGNELSIASSAVAALAIIGGYLGVSSANRNALKIAREERSSKRSDDFNELKRQVYAQYLATAWTIFNSPSEERSKIARDVLGKEFPTLVLIAPVGVVWQVNKMMNSLANGDADIRIMDELAALNMAMRQDLGIETPEDFEVSPVEGFRVEGSAPEA